MFARRNRDDCLLAMHPRTAFHTRTELRIRRCLDARHVLNHQESSLAQPLLVEFHYTRFIVDRHHTELCRFLCETLSAPIVRSAPLSAMKVDHRAIVHFVNVSPAKITDFIRAAHVRSHRCFGCRPRPHALIPVVIDALLRWHHIDELA